METMDTLAVFHRHRSTLFSVAYRMLGSRADAEDLLQECYLRWAAEPRDNVQSPKAFLVTLTTRLAIDQLRSARVRREQYVGPWLPEPLVGEPWEEPAEMAESLSMAFLVLLERLTPTERAVFLLKEVFDYDYDEIAKIVVKSAANCRQLVARARRHLREERPRFAPARKDHEAIVARFLEACHTGDLPGLLALLKHDVTLYTDGGGKVRAALRPIYGADKVARLLVGISGRAPEGMKIRFAPVNGQPGVLLLVDGKVYTVMVFTITDGTIDDIYVVGNPDKLPPAGAVGA
jgi:RNA polymerase sigma-70 factor (ECF subfamily)